MVGVQAPAQAAPTSTTAATTAATGTPSTGKKAAGTKAAGNKAAGNKGAGKTSVSKTSNEPVPYEAVCGTPKEGDAACFALRRTDTTPVKGVRPATATPEGYAPGDLLSAYNLTADGGAGQTVAIVDAMDDPTAEADLAVYREQFGLPACTTANGCLRKVDQRGGTTYPPADPHWAGEISLDLDMVSAIAPNAHILLVEADTASVGDLGAGVDEAVALGATVVSNSYGSDYRLGGGEDPSDTTLDAHYNHPGTAVVASSGDYGFGVSYPAASPYVTSVGGTSLTRAPGTARGWTETAWDSAGSGCSLYEPKPAFQTDTGCANRAVSDVSAEADLATGVAVYSTYGDTGWDIYGGTSVSAPIIAGVYADAGTPAPGSYPNSYPYGAFGAGLNDITGGSNGSCTPAYLCNGTAGYDGPTGLGTPDGLAAFRSTPHGELSGTVTDTATGSPVSGATVTAGSGVTHTAADGTYSLPLRVGTYDVTVDAYGYATGTAKAVTIADGDTLSRDFALATVASRPVSGKVTDGSGHGWPLYAKITVDGVPGAPVWTDPATGSYSLDLPQDHSYTLHVAAASPGYHETTKTVTLGSTAQTANLTMTVDATEADAPGYAMRWDGDSQPFDSTTSAPKGWSVVNATGTNGGWEFDDPGKRGNITGGTGGFAIVDSDHFGFSAKQDSQLISPVYDLTGQAAPEVSFNTAYKHFTGQTLAVDATEDGGTTWKNLWTSTTDSASKTTVDLPLTDFAGRSAVQLRFHYTGSFAWYWGVDNVNVGQREFAPVPGGLAVGSVTDANTGDGLVGATVALQDDPAVKTTTIATPDDPNVGDGLYSVFSPDLGSRTLTATKKPYTALSKTVKIGADSAVSTNYKLQAGRLTVTPGTVDSSVAWGKSATQKLTVKNTGKAAATLNVGEQPGDFQLQAVGSGAPLQRVKGDFSPLAIKPGDVAAAKTATTPSDSAWQTEPNLPQAAISNVAGSFDGKVYEGFGFAGTSDTSDLYVLDPTAGSWTKLASAADPRESPASGFINGKFYVAGGWNPSGAPDPKTEIYDPASDSWRTGASAPKPYAGAGSAVLDGKLYAIGGCSLICGSNTDASSYDPESDTWTQIASYPEPVAWESCAGISGKLYCAGGESATGDVKHAYVYDPAANSWSPIADMPIALWGSAYTSANGKLLISSGVSDDLNTNQGYAYDPKAGTWSTLPNSNTLSFRGGAALGFYKVGGGDANSSPSGSVELLPGYDQGGSSDVTWLSESSQKVTVAPGASATLTLTLDPTAPEVSQPGDYHAQLTANSDTPYTVPAVPVTMHVAPPKTWGKITGTVLGVTADGGTVPLAGATVEIGSWTADYSLKTAADGTYSLWLDTRNNPLSLIAAKDGYRPTTATVKLTKGATVTSDFTLKKQ